MHFDFVPDAREFPESERCQTEVQTADGPLPLFSDQNPASVLRQFQWMRRLIQLTSLHSQDPFVGIGTRRKPAGAAAPMGKTRCSTKFTCRSGCDSDVVYS